MWVEICARRVPPGVEAHVMGIQNIKGTGLDFIYRWVAIDNVHGLLTALESELGPAFVAPRQIVDEDLHAADARFRILRRDRREVLVGESEVGWFARRHLAARAGRE